MDEWNHLSELVLFALAMQETLKEINRFSAKNFQLRVGKWLTSRTHTHINKLLLMMHLSLGYPMSKTSYFFIISSEFSLLV